MLQRTLTLCVHAGSHTQVATEGTSAPIYQATAFGYLHSDERSYPRYFNTPNQKRVAIKVAALEGAEQGVLFASGMAAISTSLLAFLKPGDDVLMQTGLYGGTTSLAEHDLKSLGIGVTYTSGLSILDFEQAIDDIIARKGHAPKVIYLETPSNPLCNLVDIEAVATLSRKHAAISIIDNTFASPINQTPHRLGVDIVLHSATKYLGGHSDITAGIAVGKSEHIEQVLAKARHFGPSCEAQTAALLERSIKTLALRVRHQTANAQALAEWLETRQEIQAVYYPGLSSHPQHQLAKRQMHGFGAMLSFELKEGIDPVAFQQNLKLVASAMSLGGVDTTVCSPFLTSHRTISAERRAAEGISDQLIRLSMGIEDVHDIMEDIEQAVLRTGA